MFAVRPVRRSARQSPSGSVLCGTAAPAAAPQLHALGLRRRRLLSLLAVARDFVLHQQLHLCQHHALRRLARLRVRLEVCAGRVSAAAAAAPVTAAHAPGPRRSFPASSSSTATRVPMPQPQGAPAQRSAGACRVGPAATSRTAARGTTSDGRIVRRRPKPAPCPSSGHEAACAGSAECKRGLFGHDDVGCATPGCFVRCAPYAALEQATRTPKRRRTSSSTRSWPAEATSWTLQSFIPCRLVRAMPRTRRRTRRCRSRSLCRSAQRPAPERLRTCGSPPVSARRPAARRAH